MVHLDPVYHKVLSRDSPYEGKKMGHILDWDEMYRFSKIIPKISMLRVWHTLQAFLYGVPGRKA